MISTRRKRCSGSPSRSAAACVRAADHLRAAGLPCPEVSVGSTPTALSAKRLDGVTEVRAGVYVFFDLVMANIGVCGPQDIALSVLATVIGHQPDKGWVIIDAGWMAMSRDRGTQRQKIDYGYGAVCDADGRLLDGLAMTGANQEHGIVSLPRRHFDRGRRRALPGRLAAAHPAQPRLCDRHAVPGVSRRCGRRRHVTMATLRRMVTLAGRPDVPRRLSLRKTRTSLMTSRLGCGRMAYERSAHGSFPTA